MYNLLISADDQEWNGSSYSLPRDRYLEYTDDLIKKRFENLDNDVISEIVALPCIFAYEKDCKLAPKSGYITKISVRQKEVRIKYTILALERFLTFDEFSNKLGDLDIGDKMEIRRTHWSIKNVDLNDELQEMGIRLPRHSTMGEKIINIAKHNFDVAFSFAGESRGYVECVIAELKKNIKPGTYFYDNDYKDQLARPAIDLLLQDIYRNRSKLVVLFIGEKYQSKVWCGIEFHAIRDLIMERQHERVMYIRIDDGQVEGVFKTDGYIDARNHNHVELAGFIKNRMILLQEYQ